MRAVALEYRPHAPGARTWCRKISCHEVTLPAKIGDVGGQRLGDVLCSKKPPIRRIQPASVPYAVSLATELSHPAHRRRSATRLPAPTNATSHESTRRRVQPLTQAGRYALRTHARLPRRRHRPLPRHTALSARRAAGGGRRGGPTGPAPSGRRGIVPTDSTPPAAGAGAVCYKQ